MGTSVGFITSKERPDPIKYSQEHLNKVSGWEVLASNKEYVYRDYGFYTYAVYSAVKTKEGVWCAVSLIGIKKYPYSWDYEISEKLYGEDEGPMHYGASKKVLSLLTPRDPEFTNVNEWRNKCYEEVA